MYFTEEKEIFPVEI